MTDIPADIQETVAKIMRWKDTPFLSGMIATALWVERDRLKIDKKVSAYKDIYTAKLGDQKIVLDDRI